MAGFGNFLSWLGWRSVPSLGIPLEIADWNAGPNQMTSIVLADIFGSDVELPLTRWQALTIPAVTAAQNTITAAFGGLQLKAYPDNGDDKADPLPFAAQPRWLTNTGKGEQPAYLRNSKTFEDFMFMGFSCWGLRRGSDGYPLAAWHMPWGTWEFDDNGVILVNGDSVDPKSVMLIESPMPGLLNIANRTLRGMLDLEETIKERARYAVPMMTLQNTGDTDPDDQEVRDLLAGFRTLRQSRDGAAAGFVPTGLKLEILSEPDSAWLLPARNAYVADIARFTGIPTMQLEGVAGVNASTSLTYRTETSNTATLVEETSKIYLQPVEARVSMGDVTPNGTIVRFDTTPLLGMVDATRGIPTKTPSGAPPAGAPALEPAGGGNGGNSIDA